jgi:hypothetical protein
MRNQSNKDIQKTTKNINEMAEYKKIKNKLCLCKK